MLLNKKIIVVMPAYNAELTLNQTYNDIPHDIVDEVILVDDKSSDQTAGLARSMGIKTFIHLSNKGYGGNQKTCYDEAMKLGADIVIMLHPDYQYTPKLLTAMASLIAEGLFDCVLGSRILGKGALEGGMPRYKYISNRGLTFFQNIFLNHKLSEYHTGLRAFSREVIKTLPIYKNSDDFVFDNQMLAQIIYAGFRIGEITCPTLYMDDSSSISFKRSVVYGLGVLKTSLQFRLHKWKIINSHIFSGLDIVKKIRMNPYQ